MNVDELLELSKHVVLKQLKLKEDNSALLGFVNLGILEIHKRFPLIYRSAVATVVNSTDTYIVDGRDEKVVAPDLETVNLLVIEDIRDKDNFSLTPQDLTATSGVILLGYNSIQIKEAEIGDTYTIIYRGSPKFLIEQKEDIPLPYQFLEPLMLYIGYKGFSTVKSDAKSENNVYYQRFEAACKRIYAEGLHPQPELLTNKVEQRGFV